MTSLAGFLLLVHGSATAGLLAWAWVMSRRPPTADVRSAAAVVVAAGLWLNDLLPLPLGMVSGGPHLYPAVLGRALTALRYWGFGLSVLAVPLCGVTALAYKVRPRGASARVGVHDGQAGAAFCSAATVLAAAQCLLWAYCGTFPAL